MAGDPKRIELSNDPADYISGPTEGESSRTEGGTTRDGAVAKFGASRSTPRSGRRSRS